MTTALILVDHGSRRAASNAMLDDLATLVRGETEHPVYVAHMELAEPSIDEAVGRAVAEGATEVVVCPFFLGPGRHVTEDIPKLSAEAAKAHGVQHRVAAHLGADPLLAQLILERAKLAP